MYKRLTKLNLTPKLYILITFTGILPLILVGVLSYFVTQQILRNEASRYMSAMVRDQRDYLDLQLAQVESLIANISSVEEIVESLDDSETTNDTYINLATQARIGYILNGYTNLGGLVSIDIFTVGGAHYHVGDTLVVSSIRTDVKDRIYAEALSSQQKILWTGIEDNVNMQSGYKQVLTAATVISKTDLDTLKPRAVALLLVNYSVEYLYDHFSEVNFGKDAYMMIIDGKNRVIYHPDKDLLAAAVAPSFTNRLQGESGSMLDESSGSEAIVTFDRSANSDWRILSLIPTMSLAASARPIGIATLSIVFVSFLTLIVFGAFISKTIVEPIQQITRQFRLFQEGKLDSSRHLPRRAAQDEIGELMQWFNTFLDSLGARQQAENALRESDERYTLAIQGANDGIWDWDLRRNTIHYSSRWKAMLGCLDDEIGDSPDEWFRRVHPDDQEELKASLADHLEGRSHHFEIEQRLLLRDGVTYQWFLVRGLAVRDAGQKAHRMAGSFTDITNRKEIEERLRYDAMHDPLTNLSNRAYFMAQLKRSIEQAHRHKDYHGAVLFMDMDRFKIVNDSLGHASGDQMLVAIAHRLESCLRGEDLVARFGGDEFVILAENLENIHEIAQVANRIQNVLAEPLMLKGHELSMTASIGIVAISRDYLQPEEVIRDADTALYRAKANGRARYEVFDTEMHTDNLLLLRLEAELHRAVDRQEFELYYQPIVSLKTGEVSSVEALLRWNHPVRGVISPVEFIPLAEETGLIVPIGEWVLRTACEQIEHLHQQGFPNLLMAINISGRQLQDPTFLEMMKKVVADVGVSGSSLELEITESVAMADFAHTVSLLTEIKALGIRLAIDDFGTSYSSLGYLKRFPMATIKIDRSFILDSVEDSDGAAITTAIIAMAHILGLKVIAEGVDSVDQLTFLINQHCDAMQGFLFSPPIPLQSLLDLLNNTSRDPRRYFIADRTSILQSMLKSVKTTEAK